MITQKYFDTHTLYIVSGVAYSSQVSACFKKAVEDAEKVLGYETNCRFKVNLLVNRNGEYFGYGYVWVSSPEIYWMILGRNPDGTERYEEYPDPDYKPELNTKENWGDVDYVPMIRKPLSSLISLSGYTYDSEQLEHLRKDGEDVPKMGYFEISRGYALDCPKDTMKNRLCARNIPDWIPAEAFKNIFSFYLEDKTTYPMVNLVNSKKGKLVFVTFNPKENDALFILLMTKKTIIVNPNDRSQKATLIFTHAFNK